MIEAVGPGLKRVACPQFELQLGLPPERCVSIHLPRTNLGKEDSSGPNGGMLTVTHQYLCDMALTIEGSTAIPHNKELYK